MNLLAGRFAVEDGVMVYDCSNCVFSNATIRDCSRNGFETYDDITGDALNGIINSTIMFCGWDGIGLGQNSRQYFAINNTVDYCSDVGITSYGFGNRITGNLVHDINSTTGGGGNAGWGIAVEGGSYDLISNNTIVNNMDTDGCGICLAMDQTVGIPVQSNLIVYNHIYHCNNGIILEDKGYDTVTQNGIVDWGTSSFRFGLATTSKNTISFLSIH